MNKINILIFGGGPVVKEFYLPSLARLGWTDGITVVEPSQKITENIISEFPWMKVEVCGFQEILANTEFLKYYDAIVVALPNNLHAPAVEAALNLGFPVLCEKPLALLADDCRRLGRLADTKKKPLAVGMVRRIVPAWQAAESAIRSGLLGKIQKIEIQHGGPYNWISDSGAFFRKENGGVLADLGVHQLDWLGSFLGPLERLKYEDDCCGGIEAGFKYWLKAPGGADIFVEISHIKKLADITTFVGDRGNIIINRGDFKGCLLSGVIPHVSATLEPVRPFVNESWPRDFVSCFAQQFYEFAKAIKENEPVRVTAHDAAATMELVEGAYRDRRATQVANRVNTVNLAPGRAVVTGGTGFIGGAVVERLSGLGFEEIVVPVRNYRTCANVARFPVMLPRIDLTDRKQIRAVVSGARWVFHLAYGQSDDEARKITVNATRILLEESVAAKVEAVVVLSSMAVFGHPQTMEIVDESWPYAPAFGKYGNTKAEMEKWILRQCKEWNNTRVIVLNPTCVFGPGGKTYTRLPVELAGSRQFAWIEEGRGIANYIYIDNLVDAMLKIIACDKAHGERFIATDGYCTWREFLGPLLCGAERSQPSLSVLELRRIAASRPRVRLRDFIGILASNRELIAAVNDHTILGPIKRFIAKNLRGKIKDPPRSVSGEKNYNPEPVPWLGELFGPTQTRFSNAKLTRLIGQGNVKLNEAHKRSVSWLREVGIISPEN